MFGVEVVRDPAAPDDTQAFINALNTGRTVLVPAGDWRLWRGALPPLQSGQRIVGEGATLSKLLFSGPNGDAIRLSNQVDSNTHWPSGVQDLAIWGTDEGSGAGIAILGGAGNTVRDCVVGGFDVLLDLDGAECCIVDGLTLWCPIAGAQYPRYGIRFCEGAEGGRGFTVPGATNCNRITNLSVISGATVAPVLFGGISNTISGFNSNAGGWRVRGNNICIEHGCFEIRRDATECVLAMGGGPVAWSFHLDDIQVTRGPLVRFQADPSGTPTVFGLTATRIMTGGASQHLIQCESAYNLAGWCIISGDHWGPGRAVNIDQPYAEIAIAAIAEYAQPAGQGRGSIGLGVLNPTDGTVVMRGAGFQPTVARAVYGSVERWRE